MNNSSLRLTLCSAIALIFAVTLAVHGQNREKYVISATAGGVNSVIGRVMVRRAGATSEQPLTAQDDILSGDVVSTGVGARAEVLLNPGSYFRLGENSVFELVDNSLDNLRVKLVKGSAIIEATGGEDTELRLKIVTNQQPLVIVRRGIYRINAQSDSTELLVQKGRVSLSSDRRDIAKGGTRVTLNSGSPLTAKIGKYQRDEFDIWSKERGENLARANDALSARMLNDRLTGDWGFTMAAFGRYGLWTFSTTMRCYTFLPFYYGWSSPYGRFYGLYYGIYDYYYPGSGSQRNPVIAGNPPSSGGPTGGSSGSPSNPGAPPPPAPSMSQPMSQPPSQAGPRDPDSGGRSINRIKDPN